MTYVQGALSLELPNRSPWEDREFGYNVYVGRDLSRAATKWTLGVELNGENRELAVTPQIRKGLTRTGAVAAAAGARIPLNHRDNESMRWVGYVLWDYREPVRARP
jgi:hypothetical protein